VVSPSINSGEPCRTTSFATEALRQADKTTSHSTKLSKTTAKSLVIWANGNFSKMNGTYADPVIHQALNRRVGTLCPPSIELPRGHECPPYLTAQLFHQPLATFAISTKAIRACCASVTGWAKSKRNTLSSARTSNPSQSIPSIVTFSASCW